MLPGSRWSPSTGARSPPPLDAVVADNQGGAAEATGHLLAHGHRRIAFLGDSAGISTAVERRDGYRMALRASGSARDPDLERVDLRTRDDAARATHELLALEDPPTAIFAGAQRDLHRRRAGPAAGRAVRTRSP